MRRAVKTMIALAGVMAATAGVASATTQPAVLYDPPVIKALDYEMHNSIENMVIERIGFSFGFTSAPTPFSIAPESRTGCGFSYPDPGPDVVCPVAGIKRIVASLGGMNDSVLFNLRRSARRIKQKGVGGAGEDELRGRAGRQRLVGGEGNDTLVGGSGPDVLVGGPGVDDCSGGPGRDILRSCE